MKKTLPILILILGIFISFNINTASSLELGFLGAKEAGDSDILGYIDRVYRGSLYVASVLAVGMISAGGILYSISGAVDKKNEGKEMIKGAILGLILLFSATVVFNTVNPRIAKLTIPILPKDPGNVVVCTPGGKTGEVKFTLIEQDNDWNKLDAPPPGAGNVEWCLAQCESGDSRSCKRGEIPCGFTATSPSRLSQTAQLVAVGETCVECSVCRNIKIETPLECPQEAFNSCPSRVFVKKGPLGKNPLGLETLCGTHKKYFGIDGREGAISYCANGEEVVKDFLVDKKTGDERTVFAQCEITSSGSGYEVIARICKPDEEEKHALAIYPYNFKIDDVGPFYRGCMAWGRFEKVKKKVGEVEKIFWEQKNDFRKSSWIAC